MSQIMVPRGVKTRLLGVVLLFAAMMDAMLHWRGGFALGLSTILLMAAGFSFYAIGAIRAGRQVETAREDKE